MHDHDVLLEVGLSPESYESRFSERAECQNRAGCQKTSFGTQAARCETGETPAYRLCSPPGAPSATRTVTISCTYTFHTYTRATARVSATIQSRKPLKRLDQCRPAAVRQCGPLPRRARALSTETVRVWRAQLSQQITLRRLRACGSSGSTLRLTSQRKKVPGSGRNQRVPRAGHGRGRRISVRLTSIAVIKRYSRARLRDIGRARPTTAPHRPRRGCCCWARCR